MPIRVWLRAACLFFVLASLASADALVVTGARVLTPAGDAWMEGRAVLVVDGRITAIAPLAELQVPAGATALNLEGKFLVPGLIDLHTHLVLYPYDQRGWNDQVLKESVEFRTIRAVTAARDTLAAGFTTIRELGTEGAGFADVAVRDAIEQGLIPGPRVFATTRALVATGCYGPAGFAPRVEVPKGGQVADGPDGVRVAVREQIAAGADWIKVYADYRRHPGHPATPTFSVAELEAIVDEASAADIPVSAHATTDAAIRRAVLAGVDTIEHGYTVSAETLALMVREKVALCPTLAANEAVVRYSGWTSTEPEPKRLVDARAMFRRALDGSVILACGSDAGVFTHGDNAREIELMVEYGATPADALRAATSVAADVLRRDDLGRIAEGCAADLVALERDPLHDVTALRKPLVVVSRGRIAFDHRTPPPATRLPGDQR